MLSVSYERYHNVIDAVKYLPCVSIIMPFEPKMGQKSSIDNRLISALNKVKIELQENYPDEKAVPVFHKLYSLIKDLNYGTHRKSIAVFVSPVVEKIYYLDIPVKEKIVIDESFDIRDLVYSKKEIQKYLMLVLTNKRNSIFLGNPSQFTRIVSNTPDTVKNNISKSAANFSDVSFRKEILLDKFLKHTDNGLGIVLQSYPFPLFVIGTNKIIGQFKKLTYNNGHILNYIHGNFEEATETEVRKAIAPYLADWNNVKQRDVLLQLDVASRAKKLVTGMENICTVVSQKKRCLLVVEKNYIYPNKRKAKENIYWSDYSGNTNPFYIKDAIDEVIEKVFENGGNVEFADEGALKDYGHIALIQYC